MALKEKVQVFAVKKALEYMDKDPVTNMPKLLDWFDTFDVKGTLEKERKAVKAGVIELKKQETLYLPGQLLDGFECLFSKKQIVYNAI